MLSLCEKFTGNPVVKIVLGTPEPSDPLDLFPEKRSAGTILDRVYIDIIPI